MGGAAAGVEGSTGAMGAGKKKDPTEAVVDDARYKVRNGRAHTAHMYNHIKCCMDCG
jgi:hypothetical protein